VHHYFKRGSSPVVILGLILLILGLVTSMQLLVWLGLILIVVGLVLNFVPVGGTRRRVF
jgi:membrane-bound ClpP family serine protease